MTRLQSAHQVRAPHEASQQFAPSRHAAALLIDFDNVTMGIRSNLGQEIRGLLDSDVIRGKVAVQRAYADWRRFPQYIVPLSEASVDLIFAPAYGSSKKNATDIRLAIDALELVFVRPEIDTYILLSGDSDFSSLVLKLKEYGKFVIGVGIQESASDILVQNCDEYYSYNSLSGLTSKDDLKPRRLDPWILAATAVTTMADRGDVMRSDRLKQVMLELDSGFNEKEAGFSRFNRFLGEAAQREILDLRKLENGQYEISPGRSAEETADDAAVAASAKARASSGGSRDAAGGRGGSRRSGRRAGRPPARAGQNGASASSRSGRTGATSAPEATAAVREALRLLQEVTEANSGSGALRDSDAKRRMRERDPSFEEKALGFSKFSLFLRHANDENVISLELRNNGSYYISRAASGSGGRSAGPGAAAGSEAVPKRGGMFGRVKQLFRPSRSVADPETAPELLEATPKPTPSGPARSSFAAPRSEAKRRPARDRSGHAPARSARTPAKPADSAPAAEPPKAPAEPSGGAARASGAPAKSPPRRRTMSRYRSGARAKPAAPAAGALKLGHSPAAPQPTPASTGQSVASKPRDSKDSPKPDGKPDAGRRASEKPAADRKSIRPAAGSTRGKNGAAKQSRRQGPGPVGRLIKYPGVGRATAKRLVSAFEDKVFDVIDNEPQRLNEVLPKARAKAVVDARAAERENAGKK